MTEYKKVRGLFLALAIGALVLPGASWAAKGPGNGGNGGGENEAGAPEVEGNQVLASQTENEGGDQPGDNQNNNGNDQHENNNNNDNPPAGGPNDGGAPASTPEPGTLILLATGAAGTVVARYRRK